MNRLALRGHRGLSDNLREARVGVHGHPDFLRRTLHELGEDALGDQVRHLRPDGVHPEYEVGLGVGYDLEEPVGLALDQGLADGPERELRLLDFVAFFFGLRLVEPERGYFRTAEGDARDEVAVLGHRVLAGHVLDGDDTLVSGLVGEPETPDYVPRRVHAVFGRPPIPVDLDDAAVVDLHVGGVEVEVLDNGLPPDRDEQRLRLEGVSLSFAGLTRGWIFAAVAATLALGLLLLLCACGGNGDLDPAVGLLQALGIGLCTREDRDAPVLELLLEGLGNLRVLQRHETVEDLDDGHLGAEVVVHARELDADGSGAKNYHRLGIALVVGDDVVRRDYLLTVELQAGQGVDGGAGGDQDVLRLELLLAVLGLYLYLLGFDEAANPVVDGDLVLFHQALHASPELGDDLLAALGRLRIIELHLADLYPVLFAVSGVVQQMGGLEQGFGRDTSHVEAGTSEMPALPLLDQGHAHPQLAGPDRWYVSSVPTADYYEVEILRHLVAPFGRLGFRSQASGFRLSCCPMPLHHNSNCPSLSEPSSRWQAGQK